MNVNTYIDIELTEEPCFEDAVVHCRFGAEARIKE